MAMMEISVLPVGTPTASLSSWVAGAVKLLEKEKDIKFELTPMGTVIVGETDRLLTLAGNMHRSAFTGGIKRVVTTIKIDERLDKSLTIEGKIRAVKEKL
ncbi:MAG TPA: MTH1187 family thiamine-binding protein [Dehalococcoidales bacterium]|nr:MTH1187 family thiamine-binding protein [Dehalococcoidales bacterium]